jgi:hypothetical protein
MLTQTLERGGIGQSDGTGWIPRYPSSSRPAVESYVRKPAGSYVFDTCLKAFSDPGQVAIGFPSVRSIDAEAEFTTVRSIEHEFQREENAFLRMLPSLLRTNYGKFVAVVDGRLTDEDDDEIVLAERVERKFRTRLVLIRRVIQGEIQDHIPSPEGEAE